MGKGDVQIQDCKQPKIEPNEVLIKVSYCGICGTDVAAFRTGNYVPGMIIGHEFSGVVAETGTEVSNLNAGDRVAGNSIIPCGSCTFCLSGMPSLCDSPQLLGVTFNGAMAEYVKMPASHVYRLPESLSLRDAVLAEPLSCVLHAVRISSYKPMDKILIQGAGPIGILTLQLLKKSGAEMIIVTDIVEGRRKIAAELGADVTVDPSKENLPAVVERVTGGKGVNIVFDAAGVPETLRENFTLVRKGGEIVVVGICEEPAQADYFTLVLNELTVRGAYYGFNEFPTAIKMLSKELIPAGKIITSTVKLDNVVEDGFKKLLKPTDQCKIVVEIGGG